MRGYYPDVPVRFDGHERAWCERHFFGAYQFLGVQIVAALCVAALSMMGTWVILTVIDHAIGLRVAQQLEDLGLDPSQHNERASSS